MNIILGKDNKNSEDIYIPESSRFFHTLILGQTGSGKSQRVMLPFIKQDLANKSCGITIFDASAGITKECIDITKKNKRRFFYVDINKPFKFNPLKGDESYVINQFSLLLRHIMRDKAEFLKESNCMFLDFSIKIIKKVYKNKANMMHLSNFILNIDSFGEKTIYEFIKNQTNFEELKSHINISSFLINNCFNEQNQSYKHYDYLREQMKNISEDEDLCSIFNVEQNSEDCVEVDFTQHLKNKDVVIFNLYNKNYETYKKTDILSALLIFSYQSAVFGQDERNENFLYLDDMYKYVHFISDLFFVGRAYKIGICLTAQSLDCIDKVENMRDFTCQIGNLIFMNRLSLLDKRFASETLNKTVNEGERGDVHYRIIDRSIENNTKIGICKV